MSDTALVHGVAGILGGTSAMAVTYPLLTITLRQQITKDQKLNATQAALKILNDEGPSSFYAGIGPALVGVAAQTGIYTYVYEALKRFIQDLRQKPLNPLENLIVGYIAGVINTTLTCPIWRVTTRMQASKGSKASVYQLIKAIYSEGGIGGFWKGWKASIVLCINPAIQWMVYEQLLKLTLRLTKKETSSSLEIFIMGAIGKIVATLITFPYIIIKARMQAETSVTKQSGPKRVGTTEEDKLQFRYKGVMDAFIKITRKEGVLGLYSGLQSKILQSVSNAAFMFLFKEYFVSLAILLLFALKKQKK